MEVKRQFLPTGYATQHQEKASITHETFHPSSPVSRETHLASFPETDHPLSPLSSHTLTKSVSNVSKSKNTSEQLLSHIIASSPLDYPLQISTGPCSVYNRALRRHNQLRRPDDQSSTGNHLRAARHYSLASACHKENEARAGRAGQANC